MVIWMPAGFFSSSRRDRLSGKKMNTGLDFSFEKPNKAEEMKCAIWVHEKSFFYVSISPKKLHLFNMALSSIRDLCWADTLQVLSGNINESDMAFSS